MRFCLSLAAVLAIAAPASAQPGMVCGYPEVLALVARIVASSGSAAVIEPGSAGQIPTAQPQTVLCAVRLLNTAYDTNRYGLAPLYRDGVFQFTVRRGRNGLFVDAGVGY